MDLTAESASVSIGMVKERLTHAINFLVKTEQVDGSLPPGIQFGIRILQSRQRLLDRLWFYNFGTAEEREKANIELNLARPDLGELIRLGDRNHGVGRLDCRACEFEYGDGGKIEPLARLCSHCHKGIRHVYQKQTDTAQHHLPQGWDQMAITVEPQTTLEAGLEVGGASSVPPTPLKPRISHPRAEFEVSKGVADPQNPGSGSDPTSHPNPHLKVVAIPVYRLFWTCDNCGSEGMEK